jgi:hypothetical protein
VGVQVETVWKGAWACGGNWGGNGVLRCWNGDWNCYCRGWNCNCGDGGCLDGDGGDGGFYFLDWRDLNCCATIASCLSTSSIDRWLWCFLRFYYCLLAYLKGIQSVPSPLSEGVSDGESCPLRGQGMIPRIRPLLFP